MRPIIIIHENPAWMEPIQQAFNRLTQPIEEWFIAENQLDLQESPLDALYYNRMSASSHTRDHTFSPEFTLSSLLLLEQHERRVINGSAALKLEINKVAQYISMQHAGITIPKTQVAIGNKGIIAAAKVRDYPFILKPNRGGKGLGVAKIDHRQDLEAFIEAGHVEQSRDGQWLLQDYIQAPEPFITRCEFIGGKFHYAVKVNTEEGFQICPADSCQVEPQQEKFTISQHLDSHPIITQLENYLYEQKIEIAAIELVVDQQGQLYAYDLNTNTNYNQRAEQQAGLSESAYDALAKYLIKQNQQ